MAAPIAVTDFTRTAEHILRDASTFRWYTVPNRLAIGLGYSLLATGVEVLLHATGYFHWEYWFWNVPFVVPIVSFGYLWFFLIAAYVYDMRDIRRQARVVGAMAAVVAAALIVFGPILEWI